MMYIAMDFDGLRQLIVDMLRGLRSVFLRAIKNDGWDELIKTVNASDALLRATLAMDERTVEKMIQEVHMKNTYYVLIREMPAGNGFSDMVFLPKRTSLKPALIVELKWDKTAEGAINRIKIEGIYLH